MLRVARLPSIFLTETNGHSMCLRELLVDGHKERFYLNVRLSEFHWSSKVVSSCRASRWFPFVDRS